MKENPKSVQDINVKIKWKKILKVHEMLWNNPIKENSYGERDTNVTVQRRRILKVREVLT